MPLLHKIAGVLIVCAVIAGLVAPRQDGRRPAADAGRLAAGNTVPPPTATAAPGSLQTPTPSPTTPSVSPTPTATIGAAAPAAREAKANELGQVPVLMYHRILKDPEQSLDRSVKELRDELTRLAKDGYVPITAAELVSGRIDVPIGKHPVVLTFDDGSPGHFRLDGQGNPAPDTAVAVLLDVARQHPGFRPVATFYINSEPFQLGEQTAAGLRWLIQHGFEIGNHTFTHPDLSGLDKERVQKEIGRDEAQIVTLTGAHAATFAYPFGAIPRKASWAWRKDGEYDFRGVFLAGWRPAESPFMKDFDAMAIPRIRSEGKIKENDCRRYCSVAWLDWLDKHPDERYTSDGDPNTISFPEAAADRLAAPYRGQGRVYRP